MAELGDGSRISQRSCRIGRTERHAHVRPVQMVRRLSRWRFDRSRIPGGT